MSSGTGDFAIASEISRVPQLRGLANKIGPGHAALIVVDVRNNER